MYFVDFIYNLYMFRTSPDPSLGGTTVFMRHLVLVILYSWLSGLQGGIPFCIPDSIVILYSWLLGIQDGIPSSIADSIVILYSWLLGIQDGIPSCIPDSIVILYSWLSGMQDGIPSCIPDSQLYRTASTKCLINTFFPPDDGPGEVRNM